MLNFLQVIDKHIPGVVLVAAVGGERTAFNAGVRYPVHRHGVVFHPTWLKDINQATCSHVLKITHFMLTENRSEFIETENRGDRSIEVL